MKAEIISVGTELLLGEIVDTNSAYLASQLPLLGLDLHFISTIGDNKQRLVEILQQALQRSDIIITTGGLGPTQDDITREAVAEVFHEEISINTKLAKEFEKLFQQLKMEMPQSNLRQAGIIPSAQIISNPRGTAPGWWIERDANIVVTMPGPPSEMQVMWQNTILPRLQLKLMTNVIESKTLKLFGLSEAKVDELVSALLASTNPTLATYAKIDGIHLRITAKACTREEALSLIVQMEEDIRTILEDYIWGTDSDSLEANIGRMLTAKKLTLGAMESSTGGLLSNTITNVPGSSSYFKGCIVAYTEDLKKSFGVDESIIEKYGPVSPDLTEVMASIARRNLISDIGISVNAVTDPDTVSGRSIGTIYISIDDGKHNLNFERHYPGNRLQVKQRAITAALFELRKTLL
jgi:nicotinamide-nucleotide amidase